MTPERWRRIKSIVEQVLDAPPKERPFILRSSCGDDAELRKEVEFLIASEAQADRWLGAPPVPSLADPGTDISNAELSPGEPIGPYRVLREIGQGGMGAVYLAEHADHDFQRHVAVKLLRAGAESAELTRRFQNERRILATISHPNIAKFYDGGTTEDGRPYFVMEYVEGKPIDVYCDDERLSVGERLELFRKVCSAVQLAHQNLVIHRDLKPANIVVTQQREPMLLDFGIAKLLSGKPSSGIMTDKVTHRGVRLMTPGYASPEQARGAPVTTASDVYSLGVLLYELLTGRRPYELEGRDLTEITRIICEEEPTRPSAIVSQNPDGTQGGLTAESIARKRGRSSVEGLRRALRGDLDNIVMMALHKEPERRYGLVETLSQDIRHYLERRPVRARKDALSYRTTRFVQRNKSGVAAATILFVTIVAFSVVTLRARTQAEREAAKAQAVSQFLQQVLGSANTARGGRQNVSVREALEASLGQIDTFFPEQPELQAAVSNTVGATLTSMARYELAKRQLTSALEIRRQIHGRDHPDVAETLYLVGVLHYQQGDYESARSMLREAATLQQKLLGDRHPELARSLHVLGATTQALGDGEAAEELFLEALSIRRDVLGEGHPDVARVLIDLAILLDRRGEEARAEARLREAVAIYRLGERAGLGHSLDFLGRQLTQKGSYHEAKRLLLEARSLLRDRHGAEHLAVARNLRHLAELQCAVGRYEHAETRYRAAIEMFRHFLGDAHPAVASARASFGECLTQAGAQKSAEKQLALAHSIQQESLGPDHPVTGRTRALLEALPREGAGARR